MIASLIANLKEHGQYPQLTVEEIAAHDEIEVGELIGGTKLPLTIDTQTKKQMDATTRWLQELDGVASVDVVFVHFDQSSDQPV